MFIFQCLYTCDCGQSPRMGLLPGQQQGKSKSAHVPIFQLWFAMFSLVSSALFETGPEKLSIDHDSKTTRNPKTESPILYQGTIKGRKNHQNLILTDSLVVLWLNTVTSRQDGLHLRLSWIPELRQHSCHCECVGFIHLLQLQSRKMHVRGLQIVNSVHP